MKKILITLVLATLASLTLACASRHQLNPSGYRYDTIRKTTYVYYADKHGRNSVQTFPMLLDSTMINKLLWAPISPTK